MLVLVLCLLGATIAAGLSIGATHDTDIHTGIRFFWVLFCFCSVMWYVRG